LHIVLRRLLIFVTFLALPSFLHAEGTRTWEQSKFDDLIKGTANGVAVRSAGGLELAPAFKAVCTTPSTYIWAIAADREGNLYAATGSPGRVYRIASDNKPVVIFEPQELQVQALVVAPDGTIYAATNPDGKVYRIQHQSAGKKQPEGESRSTVDPSWSSSVYFDPGTKYIWDLALDSAGNLYVATGDHGEIFRVTHNGDHSTFFKSDEAHIRKLAVDSKGNVIAGSDGSGLIYRISPSGEGFVLYSAPKKEITALAIDRAGNIYAAGAGEKRSGPSQTGFPPTPISIPSSAGTGGQGAIVISAGPSSGGSPPTINVTGPGTNPAGGSEVYRISPDGSPGRVWSSREDLVYALAFDSQGHLLAGTGNRGHVFAITGEDEYSDLLQASASQITDFAVAPGGGLYASTSNLGKIFLLGDGSASEGTYESDVFDAHIFSRWGRAVFRGAGNVQLFARSGNVDNPDRNWSAWQRVELQKDAAAGVPAARFIQWKAVLHASDPAPRVDSVTLNYLPKNVAPDFDDVSIQPGVRYMSLPKPAPADMNVNPQQPHFDVPPPATRDRDSIGVKWSVHDDNDDQMAYAIYYRGDGEKNWLLLKDNLGDKFYSFDASLLPDGGYTVKVVASDAPSHSPGEALTSERESPRFEVDTTPPRIENLIGALEAGQLHVTFRAADTFSPIKRAEYSLDAADWKYVEPVGQLSDTKVETYDFRVPLPTDTSATGSPALKNAATAPLELVVVVRAYDRFDNMSSAKTVVREK